MVEHTTREEIEGWFVEWMGHVGLTGWTVRFDYPRYQDTKTDMKVNWTPDRCTVVLTIYPSVFKEVSRAKAWRDCCHEGLHLSFASMDDQIVYYIGEGEAFRQYRREWERCIDRLAGCLTGMYPVPDAETARLSEPPL